MATALAASERWKLRMTLARASEVLRQEGIRSLWFKLLGDTVYRRLLLVERPLREPILEVKARVPIEISLLQKSEIAEYREFRAGTDVAEVQSQLDAEDRCVVARHQGRLVAANWATTNHVWLDYLSCEFRLAIDEVYSYDAFAASAFRGQNLLPTLDAEQLHHFCAAGYRRMVSTSLPENRASLRVGAKSGYRPYGLIGYVKIGPWKWHFCRVGNAPT
ncbi:MAG: hypothetical protein HY268_17450 [Deltaproteobacteria bacterium]|nr:hypothetical protein [Deltaproteobacteria bacterium]